MFFSLLFSKSLKPVGLLLRQLRYKYFQLFDRKEKPEFVAKKYFQSKQEKHNLDPHNQAISSGVHQTLLTISTVTATA